MEVYMCQDRKIISSIRKHKTNECIFYTLWVKRTFKLQLKNHITLKANYIVLDFTRQQILRSTVDEIRGKVPQRTNLKKYCR